MTVSLNSPKCQKLVGYMCYNIKKDNETNFLKNYNIKLFSLILGGFIMKLIRERIQWVLLGKKMLTRPLLDGFLLFPGTTLSILWSRLLSTTHFRQKSKISQKENGSVSLPWSMIMTWSWPVCRICTRNNRKLSSSGTADVVMQIWIPKKPYSTHSRIQWRES